LDRASRSTFQVGITATPVEQRMVEIDVHATAVAVRIEAAGRTEGREWV
jgi:hypothetical protein